MSFIVSFVSLPLNKDEEGLFVEHEEEDEFVDEEEFLASLKSSSSSCNNTDLENDTATTSNNDDDDDDEFVDTEEWESLSFSKLPPAPLPPSSSPEMTPEPAQEKAKDKEEGKEVESVIAPAPAPAAFAPRSRPPSDREARPSSPAKRFSKKLDMKVVVLDKGGELKYKIFTKERAPSPLTSASSSPASSVVGEKQEPKPKEKKEKIDKVSIQVEDRDKALEFLMGDEFESLMDLGIAKGRNRERFFDGYYDKQGALMKFQDFDACAVDMLEKGSITQVQYDRFIERTRHWSGANHAAISHPGPVSSSSSTSSSSTSSPEARGRKRVRINPNFQIDRARRVFH